MAETNLYGTIRTTQAFLPLVRKAQAGRIVMISSGLGSTLDWRGPTGGFFHDGEGAKIAPYAW